MTSIDGLDIHFIHVRSRHPNALPLIMTHGWPGSVFELLKVFGPLTDPTAHGGTAKDAFHLVLRSIPGFGFSEKAKGTGWNPDRIARTWDVLMKRLGNTSYVSQGGDWGAIICDAMGRQTPSGLLGIHVNKIERSTTILPEVAKALRNGDPAPANLTIEERVVFDQAREFLNKGFGYAAIMGTRPQTIGYGLADSPVDWRRGSMTSSLIGCSSAANLSARLPATRFYLIYYNRVDKAAASRPWKSRTYSAPKCVPLSGHCADPGAGPTERSIEAGVVRDDEISRLDYTARR